MYAKGLVIGILLILLLTPLSMGDGVPIMTLSLHSITHENRQIAVIDVHGNSETMHLFLGVVSLDPGKNITVLIPVRTAPANLTVQNTTESDFYGNNSLTNASRQHERELYGANTTLHNYLLTTTLFTTGSLITPVLGGFAVFFMIAGTGAAGSHSSYMHFQTGDSAEIYNFTTLKSVEEFYSKYNMTLPPSVNDTLHRYSSFHLIALHMRTRAPIPEREYMALEEKCPKTMELVRDYVKTHPTVKAKAMLNNIYYLPDFKNVEKTLDSEAGDNYTLSQYLWDLMAGIYGYGNMRGIELSVDMPLDNGHAFYPLGTSPAWNSSGEIRVWFRVPEDRSMSFNIGPDYMVRYAGSRYYTWNFDGQLPDRDITGTVHGVDTATWLADRNEELNIYLASTDGAPGIILGMLTAIGIWFALFAIFVQLYGGGALFRDKKFIGIMVGLSLLTVFVSGLAGIMLIYYATERGLKKHNIEKDEKARQRGITFLAAVVVTVPAIGIAMIMLLVSHTTAPETFVIALLIVYFLIAAAIAIVMLFQRAARWLRAHNPNFGR